MIKFENTEVFNFEGALRGMRNPLNSWDKSDSVHCGDIDDDCIGCILHDNGCDMIYCNPYIIGENDLKLAQNLIKAGSDHRKFMRQIIVSVDIIAPRYWWTEFDTYKVGTVANSCSTMHTIAKKPFEIDDFSHEHVKDYDDISTYSDEFTMVNMWGKILLQNIIKTLNFLRYKYNETNDKQYWYQMIQLLPQSYNQRRTVTLNYEVLRNIYGSRCNHKLDEWSVGFMQWIESLPYAAELIMI